MTRVMQTAKDLTEKREVPTPTGAIARERLGELNSSAEKEIELSLTAVVLAIGRLP